MRNPGTRRFSPPCLLAAFCLLAPLAAAQTYTSQAIVLGTGGYVFNFEIQWTCDDFPSGTLSAPGEVDLVDGNGNLVAEVVATASGSTPSITVTGAGSVSNVTSAINIEGAGGTPADGLMHVTWNITGPAPGPYTLRLWVQTRSVARESASSITTDTRSAGGGGPVGAPTPTPSPTPTPTPTPVPSPPSIILSAPASAAVFQALSIGTAAAMPAGGHPLASVVVSISSDNGSTWATVSSNPSPSTPTDSEAIPYAFGSPGSALLRATVTDSAGLTASSTQAVAVSRAAQAAVSLSPSASSITAGQSVAFTASGGATGNYAWGGSASGAGPAQAVVFPSPGSFAVTVLDSGNSDYNPSPAASATVSVQAAFFTLSLTASSGGSVSGGGSYPPNADATAVATAGSGNAFSGWTGDVTAGSPSVSILMNSSKSVMAHFTALLAQAISFVPPGTVTTHTPPFALSVTASSGLPVSLALASGPVALAGTLVTPTGGTGEVAMTATQAGNTQYLPAQPVVITFSVGPPPAGVILTDDSSTTKRSDKATRTTSYTSLPAH
jgi:hypothetical protein